MEAPQADDRSRQQWGEMHDRPITQLDELAIFLGGSPDSYTGYLLALIEKAGRADLGKLAHVYPREVALWVIWNAILPAPTFGQMERIKAIIGS